MRFLSVSINGWKRPRPRSIAVLLSASSRAADPRFLLQSHNTAIYSTMVTITALLPDSVASTYTGMCVPRQPGAQGPQPLHGDVRNPINPSNRRRSSATFLGKTRIAV